MDISKVIEVSMNEIRTGIESVEPIRVEAKKISYENFWY